MKHIFLLLLIVTASSLGQTVRDINKIIGVSDSISYNNEIRIYKGFGITNGASMVRIYEMSKDEWKAELYYYHKNEVEFTTIQLKNKRNFNYIWNDIFNTNVVYIPNQYQIEYKLVTRSKIVIENGEFGYETTTLAISDGTSYDIFVKLDKRINHVYYSNPEAYLKHFPEVDELQSVCQLLDVVKNEFGIWKD